jgi:hypothetical protein
LSNKSILRFAAFFFNFENTFLIFFDRRRWRDSEGARLNKLKPWKKSDYVESNQFFHVSEKRFSLIEGTAKSFYVWKSLLKGPPRSSFEVRDNLFHSSNWIECYFNLLAQIMHPLVLELSGEVLNKWYATNQVCCTTLLFLIVQWRPIEPTKSNLHMWQDIIIE